MLDVDAWPGIDAQAILFCGMAISLFVTNRSSGYTFPTPRIL